MRELYEADFHKPGIYGSGAVWANACDVFPRMSSRVGRGRRAAVDIVVCFGWGGFLSVFIFRFLFSFSLLRTHTAYCKYEATFLNCPIYLSTSTGVRTGCHNLISLSVCVSVCVTFVVFTDCESCTRPIFINPGSMEASEYGLTRGACFVVCRLKVVAVAGLLWIS